MALDVGYFLDKQAEFRGNLTTCEDNSFVREEILDMHESSNVNWWQIWISSGVLASILLKAGVANFGVSLVRLADPFMICDGKYIGPPSNLNFQRSELQELTQAKKDALRIAGLGGVFLWGLFMNLMMANIIISILSSDDAESISEGDAAVAVVLILVSFLPVSISWRAYRIVQGANVNLADTMSDTGEEVVQSDPEVEIKPDGPEAFGGEAS